MIEKTFSSKNEFYSFIVGLRIQITHIFEFNGIITIRYNILNDRN